MDLQYVFLACMAYNFGNHLRALDFYGYAGLSVRYHIARFVM